MSATVSDVLLTAQTYLNDFSQRMWQKSLLVQFLKEAHRELQLELQINGIPVIKKKAAVITVPAVNLSTWTGEVNLPTQPNDIIEPIECWERRTGDTNENNWDLMIQKSWVPEQQPIEDLVYWNWVGEVIKFIGATASNDVKLYYNGGIPIPVSDQDVMGFINAESYIAPRLAALAAQSIGAQQTYQRLSMIAKERLEQILQYNVLAEQSLVVRRKPYRHSRPFVIR